MHLAQDLSSVKAQLAAVKAQLEVSNAKGTACHNNTYVYLLPLVLVWWQICTPVLPLLPVAFHEGELRKWLTLPLLSLQYPALYPGCDSLLASFNQT